MYIIMYSYHLAKWYLVYVYCILDDLPACCAAYWYEHLVCESLTLFYLIILSCRFLFTLL